MCRFALTLSLSSLPHLSAKCSPREPRWSSGSPSLSESGWFGSRALRQWLPVPAVGVKGQSMRLGQTTTVVHEAYSSHVLTPQAIQQRLPEDTRLGVFREGDFSGLPRFPTGDVLR